MNILLNAEPAGRTNDDYRDLASGEVLLVFHILISRDEDVKSDSLGLLKKLTIRERVPAKLQSRLDFVTRKMSAQWSRRRALIEQNAQSRCFQRARGVFKNEPCLFARHTGKPPKEVRQLRSVLEVLEQRAHRNPRAAEHPRTAYAR